MPNEVLPGFYGKLPSLGDFISRRLPADFILSWDQWLQESLYASREELGIRFPNYYRNSPIWRFVLGAGCCGGNSVAGIMAPSLDKVGRHYPIVVAVVAKVPLFHLMVKASNWFSRLEILAAELLKKEIDVKEFDHQLQRLRLPLALLKPIEDIVENSVPPTNDPLFSQVEANTLHHPLETFYYLTPHLFSLKFHPSAYNIWSSQGSKNTGPSTAVFRRLPPADRYIQFLAGPRRSVNA
jgi:type VI secretion system protein ImpM